MEHLAKALVQQITYEGKKDLAKSKKSSRGQPVPDGGGLSAGFFKTIQYSISAGQITVYSDWDHLERLLQGMPRTKMTQLVASRNPNLWTRGKRGRKRKVLPINDNGKVIFRVAPLNLDEAWVHAGITKHTFWDRGVKKWRKSLPKLVNDFMGKHL